MKKKIISGTRFHYWTVLDEIELNKGQRILKCECQCGLVKNVYLSHLKSGKSKSCGCVSGKKRLQIITGHKFNRWTVIEETTLLHAKHRKFKCACECGTIKEVLLSHLVHNKSKSCGCLMVDLASTHGMSGSRLYSSWEHMISRCKNSNNDNFKHYGGRGINICTEWKDFDTFKIWALSNGYHDGLSIDRINNDDGYNPKNCRWVTQKIQSNNTRRNKLISHIGRNLNLTQWSELLKISPSTIDNRIKNGWSVDDAFLVDPIKKKSSGELCGMCTRGEVSQRKENNK